MSARAFDVGAGGYGAEGTELVVFAFFDFQGDPKFLHSSIGYITHGGEDWEGVGALGTMDAIKEPMGLSPTRVRLSLSPVAGEYLNSAINENTWGRLCELYVGNWDGVALVRDPELLVRGKMGPPEVSLGEPDSSIGITVEDVRASLDRVNGLRATLLDHQAEHAGDTFYAWLPEMMDHRFVFNGQNFGIRGGAGRPSIPGSRPIP